MLKLSALDKIDDIALLSLLAHHLVVIKLHWLPKKMELLESVNGDLLEEDAALNELGLLVYQFLLDHGKRGLVALLGQRAKVAVSLTSYGLLAFGVNGHESSFTKTLALTQCFVLSVA